MNATDQKPKRPRDAVCPVKTAARRLVVERGGMGITNALVRAEVPGKGTIAVGTVLAKMTRAGELAPAKAQGHLLHWFANAELAWRWAASVTPRPTPSPSPKQQLRLARSNPAPVHVHKPASRADQPAVTPAGLVPTCRAAPTHDPRYQCAPGERPAGPALRRQASGAM